MRIIAKLLANIPADCPLAMTVKVMGKTIKIPSLCQLNPFYFQIMQWRLAAIALLEKGAK